MKLLTAAFFYRILKSLTKIDIPVDTGDFRLMSKRAVQHLRQLREQDRFVRGLVSWIGFRQVGVPYLRDKRYAGDTKFPYAKMFKFALDGITSFSSIPLKISTLLGYVTSLAAFLYACTVFVQKALGITVQGWATIMIGMLFLGGVQLICLGIIGEYIARIFNQTKNRPMYVVEKVHDLDPAESHQIPQTPLPKLRATKSRQPIN
jgi:dolichol-phosphate mannosyltransferase